MPDGYAPPPDEALLLSALAACTDQYGAALRDLVAATPGLGELAGAMGAVIRLQYPAADGRAVMAAAQAANGAVEMVREDGGVLGVQGIINLTFLAGRSLAEGEVPG